MDIKDIEYVLAIARHQSITKAAKELYLSQPALSLFLKKLEERLGLELFHRVGKRFVLNKSGELFAEEGLKIMLLCHQLEKGLQEIVSSDRGELRIGLTQLRGITLLPAVLPVFRDAYPNVRITIAENDADKLDSQLLAGALDIALYNQPVRIADLHHVLICPEEIVLFAHKEHALCHSAIRKEECRYPWVDIRDCARENFILNYPTQRTYQIAMQIFRQAGFEPRVVLQLQSLMTTLAICAAGVGLCIASEHFSQYTLSGVEVAAYSIGEPRTTMNLVASYRKDARLTKYARKFIEVCRSAYRMYGDETSAL